MSNRKNPALAGEYVSADPEADISVWNARLRLLEAIKRVHPVVIESLAFRVFPDYSPIAAKCELSQYDQLTIERSTPPAIRRFRTVFDSWAKKFHFEYEWMKDCALRAMWVWYENPGSNKSLRWIPSEIAPNSMRSIVSAPDFKISVRGWSMETQAWSSYEEKVRAELEQRLLRYRNNAQRLALLHGLVRAPRTYSPSNFDWFVLSQFAGESPTKIADRPALKKVKGGESTVRKGIEATRRLLGIAPTNRPSVEAPKAPHWVVDPIMEAIEVKDFMDDSNARDIATGNVPMRWDVNRTIAKKTYPKMPSRRRADFSMLTPRKTP